VVHETKNMLKAGLLIVIQICSLSACTEEGGAADLGVMDLVLTDQRLQEGSPQDGPAGGSPRFLTSPNIAANPNAHVPLAAIISFTTDVAVSPRLVVTDAQRSRTIDFRQSSKTFKLPLLGLRPATAHTIKVTIVDQQSNAATAPKALTFTTPPLPAGFPPFEVKVSEPTQMEPGVIIFSPNSVYGTAADPHIIALNQAGQVIWFARLPQPSAKFIRRLSSGNLLYIAPGNKAVEMDLLGNVVQHWHAANMGQTGPAGSTPVKIDAIHHDIFEMPSGNLLMLSKELRTYPNYPTSEKDPRAPKAKAGVVGDLVVELKRDGTVVQQWSMLDLLDPYRIGYGSLNQSIRPIYTPTPDGAGDWSHANTVIYNAQDDAILISLRHQDAVVKFSRKTGKLLWILGTPDNWKAPWTAYLLKPQAGLQWQYHQHGLMYTPQGTLLLFDNGNHRTSPYKPGMDPTKSYSRVLDLSIDEKAMQVSGAWKYGGPGSEQFFSPAVCDVDYMPKTGNVQFTDGNRLTDYSLPPTNKANHSWSRIVEVTRAASPRKVFEVVFDDKAATGAINWRIHKSVRVPDLYPPTMVH